MTRRQLEKLGQAEDLLLELYYQLRNTYGHGKEVKRLDTILGKVNELKYVEGPKRDGNLI